MPRLTFQLCARWHFPGREVPEEDVATSGWRLSFAAPQLGLQADNSRALLAFQLGAGISRDKINSESPPEESLHDRPVGSRATGLNLESPFAAPLGQQTGTDILQQNDLTGVGVVAKAGEHSSRLRGVIDSSLSHVTQIQFGSRFDGDVIFLLWKLNTIGRQFEFFFEFACRLCSDVPRPSLRRLLAIFAPP